MPSATEIQFLKDVGINVDNMIPTESAIKHETLSKLKLLYNKALDEKISDHVVELVKDHIKDSFLQGTQGKITALKKQINEQKQIISQGSVSTPANTTKQNNAGLDTMNDTTYVVSSARVKSMVADHKVIQRIGYLGACNVVVQQRHGAWDMGLQVQLYCEKCKKHKLLAQDVLKEMAHLNTYQTTLPDSLEEFCLDHRHDAAMPPSSAATLAVVSVSPGARRFRDDD